MKTLILLSLIFLLFTATISLWIEPMYEKETMSLLPYLSTAFMQCVEQKISSQVDYIQKHGGYSFSRPGVANELIIGYELEAGMDNMLTACEELLRQEEPMTRELKSISAIVEQQEIGIFLDGKWTSRSGKIIPGFVVRIKSSLGEEVQIAGEVIRTWEEEGVFRDMALESLGKGVSEKEVAQILSRKLNKYSMELGSHNVSVDIVPEQIKADSIKRTIYVPLVAHIGGLQFSYPLSLNAKDLLVGCEILEPHQLPESKEILFDCGWYSCTLDWAEHRIPRLCAKPMIYLDGKPYEK